MYFMNSIVFFFFLQFYCFLKGNCITHNVYIRIFGGGRDGGGDRGGDGSKYEQFWWNAKTKQKKKGMEKPITIAYCLFKPFGSRPDSIFVRVSGVFSFAVRCHSRHHTTSFSKFSTPKAEFVFFFFFSSTIPHLVLTAAYWFIGRVLCHWIEQTYRH